MIATRPQSEGETQQYLSFRIEEEEYAIAILRVREILRYETVTRVPSTPAFITGVINLRGAVVPVVDLAVKFGLSARQISKWTCIVIVEVLFDSEPTIIGILVDLVRQVIELAPEDISEPPQFGSRVRVDYLLGVGTLKQKLVLLLDIDRILSVRELLIATKLTDRDERELRDAGDPESSDC